MPALSQTPKDAARPKTPASKPKEAEKDAAPVLPGGLNSEDLEAKTSVVTEAAIEKPSSMVDAAFEHAIKDGDSTNPLIKEIHDTDVEAKKILKEAEKTYVESIEANSGVSAISGKKIEERAHKELKASQSRVQSMYDKMEKQRKKRIKDNLAQAAEWKKQAIAIEAKLRAQKTNQTWHDKALPGEFREMKTEQYGPDGDGKVYFIPKTKKEVAAFLADYTRPDRNGITPYEGAFMFMVGLYRLGEVRGGKERMVTLDMFLEIMHPDCFQEKGGELKLRKHTRMNINNCKPDTARSYITGSSVFNNYAADETKAMVFKFESSETGYENKHGNMFTVNVVTSGSASPGNITRGLEMKCYEDKEDGGKFKWKARDVQGVLAPVVERFLQPAETEEELARERAYRENFQLDMVQYKITRESEKGYLAPKKDAPGLTKVDLEATRRAIAERKEEERLAKMPAEEREAILEAKKKKRQERAKAKTAKLAEGGKWEDDGEDD